MTTPKKELEELPILALGFGGPVKIIKKLHLTLTYHYFDEIVSGRKSAEYRQCNPYWCDKLKEIKPGDFIIFHRGYSDKILARKILQIRKIIGFDMPPDEYHFFKCPNETYFFEIEFEKA